MRRNRRIYRGRIFNYWMEERSTYPYDKWTWHYGLIVYQRGRERYITTGESAQRPEPKDIFSNLIK